MDRGLRFPGGMHGPIPGAVCLPSDGGWQPPHSPLQRDRSSDGRLDAAQFREALPDDRPHQFLIHDRDSIFSSELDEELQTSFGLRVLRTPVRAPKANAYCERLVGTVRRECLDFRIPMSEGHLRRTLRPWVEHYNKGRPHSSLGPGMPEESAARQLPTPRAHRHKLPPDCQIRAKDILCGLHHEYSWENCAA